MVRLILLSAAVLLLASCRDSGRSPAKEMDRLLTIIERQGKVSFTDSNNNGVMLIGEGDDEVQVHCILELKKGNQVRFKSGAYNFCTFDGTFSVIDDLIFIRLDGSHDVFFIKGEFRPVLFPPLRVVRTPGGFALQRTDGEVHLKEHWNVYDGIEIFPLLMWDAKNHSSVQWQSKPRLVGPILSVG